MINVLIEGQYVPVATVAEYAASKEVNPSTMAQRVKAYKDKGSVLDAAHKVGNMHFFLVTDLDVMNAAQAREAKPKRPTVEQWMEAQKHIELLINERQDMMERLSLLDALQAAGVDNWDGYDHAMAIMRGEEEI